MGLIVRLLYQAGCGWWPCSFNIESSHSRSPRYYGRLKAESCPFDMRASRLLFGCLLVSFHNHRQPTTTRPEHHEENCRYFQPRTWRACSKSTYRLDDRIMKKRKRVRSHSSLTACLLSSFVRRQPRCSSSPDAHAGRSFPAVRTNGRTE